MTLTGEDPPRSAGPIHRIEGWLRARLARIGVLKRAVVGLRHRRDRRRWEREWGDPAKRPPWLVEDVREPVRAAVADGFLVPPGRALDIGCGIGHNAAWLAWTGFDVVGVDYSQQAIARARSLFADRERLDFVAADVCRPTDLGPPFDVVVDNGCLHVIQRELWPAYRANLLAWSAPHACFMLRFRSFGKSLEECEAGVRAFLADSFEVVQVDAISAAVPQRATGAGLLFRMRRR